MRIRLRVTAIVLATLLVAAACSNPLVAEMQSRISRDVGTALAGAPPVVSEVMPPDGATNVSPAATIEISFSLALDPDSLTSASVYIVENGSDAVIPATLSYDVETRTVTLDPSAGLSVETTHMLTVNTGVTSSSGAALSVPFESSFTTRAVNDDEILVDLSYGGPYSFGAQYPIYLTFLPHPFGVGEAFYEVEVTQPGSVSVNLSDLPEADAEDGTYILLLTHDLSNDYGGFQNDASVSTGGYYYSNGTDGFTIDFSDIIVSTGPPATVKPEAQLSPGNVYSITYVDEEFVADDAYEEDPDYFSTLVPTAVFGQALNAPVGRTIGWDDEDWIEFTVPLNGMYRIVAAESVSSVSDASSLTAAFPTELGVFRSEPGGGISHLQSDYDDPLSDLDDYGLVDVYLSSSSTYFARIRSPRRFDMGTYLFLVVDAPAPEDVNEPSNDSYATGGAAVELGLGYAAGQEHTLHTRWDTDYYYIDTTGIGLSGIPFALKTARPDAGWLPNSAATGAYGDYYRDSIDIQLTFGNDDDSNGGGPSTNYGFDQTEGGFSDAYSTSHLVSTPGIYAAEIRGASDDHPSGLFGYTGAYWVGLLFGPDWGEYAGGDDTQLPSGQNDAFGTTTDEVFVGSGATHRTIYPVGDVDFIRVYSGTSTQLDVLVDLPGTANDIEVQYTLHESDGTEIQGVFATNGTASTLYVAEGTDYFLRFERGNWGDNPPTGAYRITVTGN